MWKFDYASTFHVLQYHVIPTGYDTTVMSIKFETNKALNPPPSQ